MRKTLLTTFAVLAALATVAGINGFERRAANAGVDYNAEAVTLQANQPDGALTVGQNRIPEYNWEGTDTLTYFVLANNHMGDDYMFYLEGGKAVTYKMGLVRDGNEVTITNLCDAHNPTALAPVHELPLKGTYDASTGKITFPVGGRQAYNEYYDYYLKACVFDVKGNIEEDLTELTFTVDPDFNTLTADSSFGLQYSYGWGVRYASFEAVKEEAGSPAKFRTFTELIDFGQQYPGSTVERTWTVINLGGTDAEYVIDLACDDDAFTCEDLTGTIEAYTMKTLSFTFQPQSVGEFEGLVTISTEDSEPLMIQFAGEGVPTPDYSAIVKNGDFTFETNIEFPYAISTLAIPIGADNAETVTVAKSGTNGRYGVSKLIAHFNVPEGKLGTLTFKDYVFNGNESANYYKIRSAVLVDDMDKYEYITGHTGFIPEEFCRYEFQPGDHYVMFYHDNAYYTGFDEDGTYVWDLDLQFEDLVADAAEVLTPEVNLGNLLFEEDAANTKEGVITLLNRGYNDLSVISATSDNDEITVSRSGTTAKTLEKIELPVTLQATSAEDKVANITIVTSAGTFTAVVKAHVIQSPDLMSIVKEGREYVTMTNNEDYPFIINEAGKAVNITHGIAYETAVESNFTMTVNVPEGYFAKVSWEGDCYGSPSIDYYERPEITQWGGVRISLKDGHGNSYWGANYNESNQENPYWIDGGSQAIMERGWQLDQYFTLVPGTHHYQFYYSKGGYNEDVENDYYEIYDVRIELIPEVDYRAELATEGPVEFEETYVGPQRYTTQRVSIRNTGSQDLYIEEPDADMSGAPFYYIVPDKQFGTKFNSTIDVTLWFYPSEEGTFEKNLKIKTTAGVIEVPCKASTLSMDGIVYAGDFEDYAYGWQIFDADGDYECWNLGSNLWGNVPRYVHSGHECIGSISDSNELGAVEPDNWTVSPEITVPENGATLTFYASPFHPDKYQEHYSVYISEDFTNDYTVFLDDEAVISETFTEGCTQDETGFVHGWVYRTVDLSKYAGKKIHIAFRHHDCTAQYILRIDDVFVYTGSGVKDIQGAHDGYGIARQEIFDINGNRLGEMQNGVNIVRTVYTDGSSLTSKVIIKK